MKYKIKVTNKIKIKNNKNIFLKRFLIKLKKLIL